MDFTQAQNAITRLYFDTCDVYEKQEVRDGNRTVHRDVLVHTNIPCHVSHNRITRPKTTDKNLDSVAFSPQLTSKISLSPDVEIKAGSKIVVRRGGTTIAYKNSSAPSVFPTHQEVAIDLDDDYS